MLSYAQNFEDLILSRAFQQIEHGFYIDVGAWDPWIDSVTAHFYLKGWSGVNIEPNPLYAQLLREARPRDIAVEAAVDRLPGQREFHLFQGSGCSAFEAKLIDDPRLREYEHSVINVKTTTLDEIFDEYAPEDVHFLKIDCEGAEAEALAGLNLSYHRPWVILVESLEPLSRQPSQGAWEPALIGADYRFVYFDALNRFYVARERYDELHSAFSLPPNLFDGIGLARHASAMDDLRRENERLRDIIRSSAKHEE